MSNRAILTSKAKAELYNKCLELGYRGEIKYPRGDYYFWLEKCRMLNNNTLPDGMIVNNSNCDTFGHKYAVKCAQSRYYVRNKRRINNRRTINYRKQRSDVESVLFDQANEDELSESDAESVLFENTSEPIQE